MPRRLLRDGVVVEDDWTYLGETASAAADIARVPAALIVPFDQWLADKARWQSAAGRLGVVLGPSHKAELLAPDLPRFALVAAEFSGPSEGRGYSQGRMLRERLGFRGELRATGYVRRDQLFFLARCGFTSFELPDSDLRAAGEAFGTFSATYQPSNDAGLAAKLRQRSA